MLPGSPPPPGVAIQKAAAIAEKKDPEQAVIDARAKVNLSEHADAGIYA